MAYFQATNLRTEAEIIERKQIRTAEDMVATIEVPKTIEIDPAAYGYEHIGPGDVIELKGRLEQKAKDAEKVAKANDETPAFTSVTSKAVKDNGLTVLEPAPRPVKVKRGSQEWLEQRAQFRRI